MIFKNIPLSENIPQLGNNNNNNNEDNDPSNRKSNQMQRFCEKLRRPNENTTESSRAWAFCDRCCGEREHQQQPQQQHRQQHWQQQQQQQKQRRQQQQQQQQHQPGIVAFYRSYTDSVSDLSSYRFVSDEEETNVNDAVVVAIDDDDDDVGVGSLSLPFIEIEQRQPKTSTISQDSTTPTTTNTKTVPTDKALKVETSHASSANRRVLPIICCYTINKFTQQQQQQPPQQEQLSEAKTLEYYPNEPCRDNQLRCCDPRRRQPPPVPPKPKPRICFEVTACSDSSPDPAEPALKTRRLEQQLIYPLEYTTTHIPSGSPSGSGNGSSCSTNSNSTYGSTPVAVPENSRNWHAFDSNHNCKYETASLQSKTAAKSACVLRYDRNGHLKQEFTVNQSTPETERHLPCQSEVVLHNDAISEYYINAPQDVKNVNYIDLYKATRELSQPKLTIADDDDAAIIYDHLDLNLPDDSISNCSEKTVFIHNLDQSNSSSNVSLHSTFASISLHNLTYCSIPQSQTQIAVTPLQLRHLPIIQTFDCSPYAYTTVTHNGDKDQTMEKRRNTLDRFQRLTFGRKSTPSTSKDGASNSRAGSAEKTRKTSDRSERLKELTELLRGGGSGAGGSSSRASSTPTPPPVPPPRRPRLPHNNSTASSLELQDNNSNSSVGDPCQPIEDAELATTSSSNNRIRSPLQKQNSTNSNNNNNSNSNSISVPNTSTQQLIQTMRPNASLSNLEAFLFCTREKSRTPPPPLPPPTLIQTPPTPTPEAATATATADHAVGEGEIVSSEWATQLSRAESRTAKGILPFRSVSFSQIDCKSTLSALRDRLRRDKAIESPPPTPNNNNNNNSNNNYNTINELPDPGWVHIPLKSTGVCINLNYGQEKSLENVLEDVPDSIAEEDIFNTDNCSGTSIAPATASSVIAAHAKMESLSDTIHSESECNVKEEEHPVVVEPNVVQLLEEQLPMETPPDNILQTATTCLIPVPVYECAAQEWLETPAQEWVELAPEFGMVPETTQPPVAHAACKIMQTETLTTLPTISVSRSSEEAEIINPSPTEESTDPCHRIYDSVDEQQRPDELDLELRGSEAIATPRHSTGERHKRHLDKSTKRKGMYIDNSDWHQPAAPHRGLALDISIANFQAIKPDSPDDSNSPIMFEMNTPEHEKSSPSWRGSQDKPQLLSSFSCQSSEEKDDTASNTNSKSNSFLHADSMSDTEERISWSPTPSGDYESKRYSKRPLTVRGPYGQMLEAELKKPNRMHFEEILEEMRDSDCLHPRRDTKPSLNSIRTNMPQYSSSMRVRKSNAYLPVPTHARAASTPSQLEHVNGKGAILPISVSAKDLNETISASDKQLPHQMKRAASEAPQPKSHHSKRSQSISGESKAPHQHHHSHHHHHAKRNVDGNNSSSSGISSSSNTNKSKVPPTAALLAELLKGSSENMLSEQRQKTIADTRTYVVQEIYRNEQSYVESLQTVVMKYFKVLKAPEHAGMIDTRTVDEIFFMVPDILEIHEKFLSELKQRLDDWDIQQKVGDAFIETFSKLEVLEVYTSFVNNCNRAKNAIRSMKHQRPSFAKFLESTAREHKGKLTLDNLLIKPVQKFPNYELLFQRLIKHTDHDHPDQKHLQDVLKLVHDILVHINCKEREIMENGQREATLRELEGVIEGITDLIAPERQFLLFDLVSMPSGQGARKDRGFFLFNDLLVLTSIKKRSGTIRKPNSSICPGSVASTLDTNKYKFLTKISLDCLEIVKTKDENIKRIVSEIENLAEDCNKLQQITDIATSLKYPHQYLEDVIRELHRDIQRQLSERQTNDTQLNMLELTVSSPNGSQKLTVVFSKTEKRTNWEEAFNEAKLKLAATLERHPIPEFLTSIPIRKTRAGLQFTCAAATLSDKRDVWVCNSDGYVGQVCIMSLHPEPNVTSCNGVCNARILCVASVPAYTSNSSVDDQSSGQEDKQQTLRTSTPQHSYTQQLRDYRKSISPIAHQPAPVLTAPEKKKVTAAVIGNGADASSNQSDTQLDLNLSSSDDETDAISTAPTEQQRMPSPAPSLHAPYHHAQQDSNPDESESNQSTMWIGTEDGCIHVYNSTDNIRIKKNRIKIEHHSAVFSILYLDNRVFVSLANGDICVYLRDGATSWNTCLSHCLSIGTVTSPVTKLLNVNGKLWCSIQGIIKVLDTESFSVVNQIQISSDSKPITNMTVASNYVWISIQNSAHIKCFHSNTHQLITEVNLAPAVNKMLSNCDEIIRQHKAACLRVTSLLCCKDLIWIGTSAGVLLTIPAQGYEKGAHNVVPTGIPHGHTGHVRFLTFVETPSHGVEGSAQMMAAATSAREAGSSTSDEYTKQGSTKNNSKSKSETKNILIISGGDGYEDFRNSGANSLSEIAGREDSTNHLLIWQI